MQSPLVTVVIPAFNAAGFIGDALGGVLAQTYRNLEVVVVDDGSTDGTASVVRAFTDSRVRLVSTPNAGVGAARNCGWRLGRGELVAFLDADDRWFPEKLQVQTTLLRERPEVGLVGCLMQYMTDSGRILGVTGTPLITDDEVERIRRAELMPFPISSVVMRRTVLEQVEGFDETLQRAFPGLVEDIDLVARAARVSGVACIPRVLGAYRVHGGGASARHFFSQRLGVRFVRARLARRDAGGELTIAEFLATYRLSHRQRWGDVVAWCYRQAGLHLAEGRWAKSLFYGLLSAGLGPRYTLRRLVQQRVFNRGRTWNRLRLCP